MHYTRTRAQHEYDGFDKQTYTSKQNQQTEPANRTQNSNGHTADSKQQPAT